MSHPYASARLESASGQSKQLVVVAGLSAAGQTTFLRQLTANELPGKIISQLPKKSESWPQAKLKEQFVSKIIKDLREKQLNKLVLHLPLNGLCRKDA